MPNKELAVWSSPNGTNLPVDVTLEEALQYNNQLSSRELQQAVLTFNNKLYDMSSEYIWNRTIAILTSKILQLGNDFVLEMLGRFDDEYIENISATDVINLAAELGFINKAGRMKLQQSYDSIRYYQSREAIDSNEIMDKTEAERIIKACIQYVLCTDKENFQFTYNNFREKLTSEYVITGDDTYNSLKNSPYFYKRTTLRTLQNLLKNTKAAEFEIVAANLQILIPAVWNDLVAEDKYALGFSYAEAINNGDMPLVSALKAVLLKVHGFNYVPENLRSQSFIDAAKSLLDKHNGMNNYYNEPAAAEKLASMGTSIPIPALSDCLTAVLACKIGNHYGYSWSAQKHLDEVLKNISKDRWEYFVNQVLPVNNVILDKLQQSKNTRERWFEIVRDYDLSNLNITNTLVKRLLEASDQGNHSLVHKTANDILQKLM